MTTGLTGAQIVELACIILAGAAVAFLTECHVKHAGALGRLMRTQIELDDMTARAIAAEAVIAGAATPPRAQLFDQAAYRPDRCPPVSPRYEAAVDQALEQAHPAPTLRAAE